MNKNIKTPPRETKPNGVKRYGSVRALDARGGGSTPPTPTKVYKAIWLTEEMANDIKVRASKKGQTIIQFIASLLLT